MANIMSMQALLALLAWPFVVAVLFKSLSLERALIWSILGGYMWLPQLSEIDLPLIPSFDKTTIPNLSALIALTFATSRVPALLPQGKTVGVLLAMYVISPVMTVLTNTDPIVFGLSGSGTLMLFDPAALTRDALPGLRVHDSLSVLLQQMIMVLPMFMAYRFLRSEAAIRDILVALVIAGALYALPMLFEVRMSPQLHIMIYGYFQHDFIQAIRNDGFRPFVFMPHGLWVAFFSFMVLMASLTMTRLSGPEHKMKWIGVSAFMFVMLVLCKSMGPLILALVFGPLILFAGRRFQLLVTVLVASVVLTYPILRGVGLVPAGQLVETLESYNPDRAQSLGYRFDNEDLILEHVQSRPLFGWGGWGRFVPHEARTGRTDIVADGEWIISIGHFGWLGYIAQFGLLSLPLFILWWQARQPGSGAVTLPVAALALILSANLLDLLPNATLVPFTWLIAGALLGYAEEVARARSGGRTIRSALISAPGARGKAQSQGRRTVL